MVKGGGALIVNGRWAVVLGWEIYLKLDLKLWRCRGLQTPDERKEALLVVFNSWRAVGFISGLLPIRAVEGPVKGW